MAIISCPNCGKQISSRIEVCPYCDATLSAPSKQKETARGSNKTLGGRVCSIVAALLCLVVPYLYFNFQVQSVFSRNPPIDEYYVQMTWSMLLEGSWFYILPWLIVAVVLVIGKRNISLPISFGILFLMESYIRLDCIIYEISLLGLVRFTLPVVFFVTLLMFSFAGSFPKFNGPKDKVAKLWFCPLAMLFVYIVAEMVLQAPRGRTMSGSEIIYYITIGAAGTLMAKWLVQEGDK